MSSWNAPDRVDRLHLPRPNCRVARDGRQGHDPDVLRPRCCPLVRQLYTVHGMTAQRKNGDSHKDPALIRQVLQALDMKYDLHRKIAREPETKVIIEQFTGRLERAFGDLSAVKGKRILDIGCGSKVSRHPTTGKVTPMFEPWFCRILIELGADAVGVDLGDLEGEAFEHYRVDLGRTGALDFVPDSSFDGIQDSRIFGSPEFTTQHPATEDYYRISQEIKRQEQRLLRPGGVIIHTDIE